MKLEPKRITTRTLRRLAIKASILSPLLIHSRPYKKLFASIRTRRQYTGVVLCVQSTTPDRLQKAVMPYMSTPSSSKWCLERMVQRLHSVAFRCIQELMDGGKLELSTLACWSHAQHLCRAVRVQSLTMCVQLVVGATCQSLGLSSSCSCFHHCYRTMG